MYQLRKVQGSCCPWARAKHANARDPELTLCMQLMITSFAEVSRDQAPNYPKPRRSKSSPAAVAPPKDLQGLFGQQGTRDTSASVRRNFGRCTLTKPHSTRQRYSLCPCETSNSPMCICANTVDVQARTCLRSDMCTTATLPRA